MSNKIASLNTKRLKLSDVSPHPANPNTHPHDQISRLEHLIEKYGYAKGSMVVNQDNVLLAGHGVWETLQNQNYTEDDFIATINGHGK